MSIQSIQSSINSLQRELNSLHNKMADEAKKEASATEKISRAQKSMASSKSLSTIQNMQRDIDRCNNDLSNIQRRKADYAQQIARKMERLHKYNSDLMKEQERVQKKFMDDLKRQQNHERNAFIDQLRERIEFEEPMMQQHDVDYDIFICHASEDKTEFVRPLADKCKSAGFRVWYDEFELTWGDNLRRSIDKGLANSKFGIVILSSSFFAKEWPQYELDGLVTREMDSPSKIILPIWHKVSKDEVCKYSPSLANKVALNTATMTIDEIVEQLNQIIQKEDSPV